MAFFVDKVPLMFLAVVLLMLVVAVAIMLESALIDSFYSREPSGHLRLIHRFWPIFTDLDITLLFFWMAFVMAVVVSLIVAVLR